MKTLYFLTFIILFCSALAVNNMGNDLLNMQNGNYHAKVAVKGNNGYIYVAAENGQQSEVDVYDVDTNLIKTIAIPKKYLNFTYVRMGEPLNIALDDDKNIYVMYSYWDCYKCHRDPRRVSLNTGIIKYDTASNSWVSYKNDISISPSFAAPSDQMLIKNGYIYANNLNSDIIYKKIGNGGDFITAKTTCGISKNSLTSFTVDDNNNIYVACGNTVYSGNLISNPKQNIQIKVGGQSPFFGINIAALLADGNGNLYALGYNGQVQVYNKNNQVWQIFINANLAGYALKNSIDFVNYNNNNVLVVIDSSTGQAFYASENSTTWTIANNLPNNFLPKYSNYNNLNDYLISSTSQNIYINFPTPEVSVALGLANAGPVQGYGVNYDYQHHKINRQNNGLRDIGTFRTSVNGYLTICAGDEEITVDAYNGKMAVNCQYGTNIFEECTDNNLTFQNNNISTIMDVFFNVSDTGSTSCNTSNHGVYDPTQIKYLK